jgi:anthranilate synthase component 2
MIVVIDNYDSFTYNLVHFIGELGSSTKVYRNDQVSILKVLNEAKAIILSPGPCTPNEAGICVDLVRANAGKIPLLGVCLGHQSVAQAYGANIVRAPTPMHGKLSEIEHNDQGVFEGLDQNFHATRYHSLTVDPLTVSDELQVTATTDNGVIMGLSHCNLPVYGVQFHPESIASEHGHALLNNFLRIVARYDTDRPAMNHSVTEISHG